jgi:serine/threonine protein phosphatase PrpC
MRYQLTHHSLRGGRAYNQDRVIVAERDNAVLMVVADGLGGHAGGEIASEMLTQILLRAFQAVRQKLIQRPSAFLALAILQAHNAVVARGRQNQPPIEPRTTCVACLVQNGYAYWAHVGDSRLYHFRDGHLLKRTRDHTSVEQLRQDGLLSDAELREHPHKSRLMRCVGGPNPPSITLGEETLLHPGDTLLLCTDGVWETHPDEELARFLAYREIEEGVEEMLLGAQRQKREHCDNISAAALRWEDDKIYGVPLQGNQAVHVDQEQLWRDAHRWMSDTRVQDRKLAPPPPDTDRRGSIESGIRDIEAFLRNIEPKPKDS